MEYMTSWLAILFEVECPQAESALIVPQGNSVSPGRHEISSPVDCPYCSMLSAPGEVNSHCAPGELGITSWLWNNYDQWTGPWGSQLPLCPRGILSPCSTVSFDYAPGKLNISSWMWNIITSGLAILFNAEYPWGSQLPLCPRGILSPCSTVSFDYTPEKLNISSWMWNTITRGLAILLNVECPRGIVHSHCAPGEFSINSWPWSIITRRHHIVKCCVPRGRLYSRYAPREISITSWLWNMTSGLAILFEVECPQAVCSHCAPGELSISSSLWNIITSGLAILFNVECPWGRVYSHCAPGELSIISWTSNCSNPNGPRKKPTVIVPQGSLLSPVGYEILSRVGHC